LTFGWQGFVFDHPDDWAPASLTGTYNEGYARLSSSGRVAVQIRWHESRGNLDLANLVERYHAKLRKDAARSGEPFTVQTRSSSGPQIEYRWSGTGQGRGVAFFSKPCSRLFIIEVIGGGADHLLPFLRSVKASFRSADGDLRLWSVLGLSVSIPSQFVLSKHQFEAGKTQLHLSAPSVSLECTRWGFAGQLLAKYPLADWSRAALNMTSATLSDEREGLRLAANSVLTKTEALVLLQGDQNQIVTVKSTYRKPAGRPQWEWVLR